jgi:hypothetical protein
MKLNIQETTSRMLKTFEGRFVCNEATDLVLEGFPRSGNTFSVDFISHLNKNRNLSIAHHTHNNANLLLGIAMGVPTVALIRQPIDAISSYMIYSGKSVELAAKDYYNFYEELLAHKTGIIFVKFDDVVQNMNLVINQINSKYGLELQLSTNLTDDSKFVQNMDRERAKKTRSESEYIKTVGAPTEGREIMKDEIRPIVSSYLLDTPKCQYLYNDLLKGQG